MSAHYTVTIQMEAPAGPISLRDIDDMTNGLRWVVKDCGAIAHAVSFTEEPVGPIAETHPLVVGDQLALTRVDL